MLQLAASPHTPKLRSVSQTMRPRSCFFVFFFFFGGVCALACWWQCLITSVCCTLYCTRECLTSQNHTLLFQVETKVLAYEDQRSDVELREVLVNFIHDIVYLVMSTARKRSCLGLRAFGVSKWML